MGHAGPFWSTLSEPLRVIWGIFGNFGQEEIDLSSLTHWITDPGGRGVRREDPKSDFSTIPAQTPFFPFSHKRTAWSLPEHFFLSRFIRQLSPQLTRWRVTPIAQLPSLILVLTEASAWGEGRAEARPLRLRSTCASTLAGWLPRRHSGRRTRGGGEGH